MDPASHATFGVTIVRALGFDEARGTDRVRGPVMATVLGALAPDIDAIVMPFGWDRYLRIHEIGTHTIVGAIVCGLLTAGLVWFFVNCRYRTVALCASVGALSHVLLDLLSSARLKPGWPFVDTVISLPVVAMADPWLLALCIIGALAVRFSCDSPRGAAIGLGLIAAFVVAKGTLGYGAIARYQEAIDNLGEPAIARAIEAKWAALAEWRVSDATATHLRVWRASVAQAPRLELSWRKKPESQLAARSRGFSTVSNFLAAHEFTFWVAAPPSAAPATILWSDIRFCWNPDAPGAAIVEPIVDAPERGRLACGLWFGGEIGADGRLGTEIVRIGRFTQTR
jgi:membrane-bound metal-dependent hydrolase YbcI (DUF457 family)